MGKKVVLQTPVADICLGWRKIHCILDWRSETLIDYFSTKNNSKFHGAFLHKPELILLHQLVEYPHNSSGFFFLKQK